MVCAGGLRLAGLGALVVVCWGDGGVAKGDRMQEALCVASIGALRRVKKLSRKKETKRTKTKRKCKSDKNPYAIVVGLCRG